MPGFTRREQATLSFLIRNQRKAITPNNSDYGVTEDWVLVMILRLAIVLNRGRVTSKPPKIEFRLKSHKFDVTVNADWLSEHPLTQFDLEREASYWSTVGIEFRLKGN